MVSSTIPMQLRIQAMIRSEESDRHPLLCAAQRCLLWDIFNCNSAYQLGCRHHRACLLHTLQWKRKDRNNKHSTNLSSPFILYFTRNTARTSIRNAYKASLKPATLRLGGKTPGSCWGVAASKRWNAWSTRPRISPGCWEITWFTRLK